MTKMTIFSQVIVLYLFENKNNNAVYLGTKVDMENYKDGDDLSMY